MGGWGGEKNKRRTEKKQKGWRESETNFGPLQIRSTWQNSQTKNHQSKFRPFVKLFDMAK